MPTWLEDVQLALATLGGVAPLKTIYEEIARTRSNLPVSYDAIIRRTIETNSSDSSVFGGNDLFFSVHGKGEGIWGLRSFLPISPTAVDIEPPPPSRVIVKTSRIIRDTGMIRELKLIHKNCCQICGDALELSNGKTYSEGHHIKPLGSPHHGPDIPENILILCPNHHALCDLLAIDLSMTKLRVGSGHVVRQDFIDYHNSLVVGA
jgi:HNH endonuclease